MEKYYETLVAAGCTSLEILQDMIHEDLIELGLPKFVARSFMKHINVLAKGGTNVNSDTTKSDTTQSDTTQSDSTKNYDASVALVPGSPAANAPCSR